jgi:hypothetical protein
VRAWIDHTGLHAAGRCLVGDARLDQELRSFLQFVTLIPFAQTIAYSGFEPGPVTESAEGYREELAALGLPRRLLRPRRIAIKEYCSACAAAAEIAADEWPDHFKRIRSEQLKPSFDAPTGAKAFQKVARLIDSADRTTAREAHRNLSDERASAAIKYMLVTCPKLLTAARTTRRGAPSLPEIEGYWLESYLRTLLNDQLARRTGGIYVPAVSRAEHLSREHDIVVSEVEGHLAHLVSRVQPPMAPLPRVYGLLMNRSKGEPAAMVQEALELRAKGRWIRKYLRARTERLRDDPFSEDPHFDTTGEVERFFRAEFGLDRRPKLPDAIDIKFDLGGFLMFYFFSLPPIGVRLEKFMQWFEHQIWRRRLLLLTSLAKSTERAGLEERYIRVFAKRARGRT